ncbi:MAG: hypothetical protein IJ646_14820 [Clostridia bacterium]|nr:hypothetical protein [Clostridia bacterium]
MQLQHLILLFFIYACLGWGCEVAYAACKEGRFINRGFLNGPICPIYGFGVVGVVLALAPVQENMALLFLGSVVLTSAIELVTGWALEQIFHTRWWDYSDQPLNLGGYVCLVFSLIWGVACTVVVRWVHPTILAGVALLPFWACVTLDAVFGVTFAVDLCATVVAVRKLSARLTRLTEAAKDLHALSDELGQNISDTTLTAREKMREGEAALQTRRAEAQARIEEQQSRVEAWLERQKADASARTEALRRRFEDVRARMEQALNDRGFGHRRLLDAFPNLRSHRNQEAVDALRRFYERRRKP